MWIRKHERDRRKGVDSPMPTQIVSTEEFIPRRQNERQKQVEQLIGEMGAANAKRLGIPRRDFMRTSMGLATCFLAMNRVYGDHFEVEEAEAFEPAATEEKYPKGEYFIIDVQAHFTNGYAIGFRNGAIAKDMGFELKEDIESYGFRNFVKEMFFDSETDMIVTQRRARPRESARSAGGAPRRPGARRRHPPQLADGAGPRRDQFPRPLHARALRKATSRPIIIGISSKNAPDKAATIEQMEREMRQYGVRSWKWYCHTDPGRTGGGFQLDDANASGSTRSRANAA